MKYKEELIGWGWGKSSNCFIFSLLPSNTLYRDNITGLPDMTVGKKAEVMHVKCFKTFEIHYVSAKEYGFYFGKSNI